MSTTSLPSYVAPSFTRTPSYTAEPQAYEQRLALNRLKQRPSSEFTKQSKGGGIALRFLAQDENASFPVYGTGDIIEGIVDIAKTEGVNSVGVKVRHQPSFIETSTALISFPSLSRSRACSVSRRLQRAAQSRTSYVSPASLSGTKTATATRARRLCPSISRCLPSSTTARLTMYIYILTHLSCELALMPPTASSSNPRSQSERYARLQGIRRILCHGYCR